MAHVTVMAWQRVLMYVDGRLKRVLEPGRHRYRPRRTTLLTVDLRPRLLSVPGQELITADGVSVRVTVTAQWRVTDAAAYTEAASVPDQFLYSAVQDAIRERVPALTLEAALADRAALSEGLTERVREEVSGLGIEVGDVRTRDVMLPGELRRAAMDVVIAKERGKAALEEARAEAAALRSLANTARLLEEHPALLRLRTLQVAAERQTTLVLDPRSGTDGPA
ncbi:regulator of protease activity HflC (stomatin/prohibitin superfamily) [Nonomuraea thailandensis]|uniref:Regulator of protease activity HflC (Stomatin/prohibitin superfamily) n=1 Tax=Nonomuraea thailandensis TaxID=1188745 RepID=A0A9X2GJ57_9ACTN|nr:slipin family protein [Nonomuraea thailandensis]MCP2358647.1 regulator of protease activity HflC (stomatin/prohibitin superfamily) [Nonomuraea thailandensis]